ncbi:MAG: glycosyltransferase [Betaproteobacteria bacterium RIFCSPHIGHO2_12_FULL_69_13]|nr:MAG: glycosyltransferase [Betaproteobacteria bacterium RIFCSPHIGHO2_12_FULL_69_13]OGA69024.1 MAG: glycosyltransferase [Betaproteobacteria bacterium RIFCSPLOWO2_12_FULL_68_20]
MLNVFIGYDPRESVAFYTLAHSILRRATIPVSIAPLMRSQLGGLYRRERGPTESTEFSLTRFLVPKLSDYRGWSVFMDCDMLCRADIATLAVEIERQPDRAVLVCKHDYVPKTERKFLNQIQTKYARKNWSSLMILNNERCRALTPEYVNSAPGLDLHRFAWIEDAAIGDLPSEWNWLVGEYEYNPAAKIVHFTLGGPYFDDYRNCDYAGEWFAEFESMRRVAAAPRRP